MYDKLVTKLDNIDTNGFVLKTKYDTDKSDSEKKIPDTSGLVKKQIIVLIETESKTPSSSGLVTNSALTEVENKIPDFGSLVRKTDYNAKILDIEKKV